MQDRRVRLHGCVPFPSLVLPFRWQPSFPAYSSEIPALSHVPELPWSVHDRHPNRLFSAWPSRIWEPLTQQGVSALFSPLSPVGDSFVQGPLDSHLRLCVGISHARRAPNESRRSPQTPQAETETTPLVVSASVPLLPLRSLRQRLRALRPRPALLLAELPRHRPSRLQAGLSVRQSNARSVERSIAPDRWLRVEDRAIPRSRWIQRL